jgi:uncharacterized protein (TIGR02118 family)
MAKGVLTVGYKHGIPLDEGYYTTKHVEIVGRVWGPLGLERAEIRRVGASPDGTPSQYQIVANAYFPSVQAARDVLQHPASAEVMADIANYYKGTPDVFIGEVLV